MNFENFFTNIPKSCKLIETNARIASKEIAYMWKSKDTAIACINIITLIDKKVLQLRHHRLPETVNERHVRVIG